MKHTLDKIVIIDVESTCWEGTPPIGMESDIIEIGVCLLDIATGALSDIRGILVQPQRSAISEFCSSLTTITPEMVESDGISFKEACMLLRKAYSSRERVWASYGNYDLKQFQKQCAAMQVPYPFGPSHINVKTLFALKQKLPAEVGMDQALHKLKLPLEGTHHRGVDDAYNIAKILKHILN